MPIGSGLSAQIGLAEEVYTNEVQSITGAAGGAWTLTFDGATTTSLTTTDTATNIQNALNALPNIGAGGVACTGGPLGTSPVVVTFSGVLVQKRNVPLLVSSLAPNPTIATSTPGTGYGDFVTPTRFIEVTDENVMLTIDRIESKTLRPGNQVLRSDRQAANKRGVAGDIDAEFATKGFGMILKHMLDPDGFAITTPTNGVLTRQHRAQLGAAAGFQTSLTFQAGRPDTTTTVRPFSWVGCKIISWELSQALDDLLRVKLTIDGRDEDTTQALASASYASTFDIFHFGQAQVTIAGANVDMRKLDLKCVKGMATNRTFLRNDTRKKEPIRNAIVDLSGSLEGEFTDMAAYNRFVNGNIVAVTAVWTGSLIETVAAPGPYSFKLTVMLPAVRFDGQSPDAGGPDIITQTLPFRVLNDATALSPITIDLLTTDTAA